MRLLRSNGALGNEAAVPRLVLLAGIVIGIVSFFYYYAHGLTLAHYDAKAHLLVARRIVDSLEPGYAQMGAHWLPLVHLLYLPLVIFDSQYRSGFLPSLISVVSFAFSGWLTFRIARRTTGSLAAGVFAAAVLLANPNLHYLQSCPLTEPVYMVLLLLALDSFMIWRDSGHTRQPWLPAIWVTLGTLCRYEGWYVLAGLLALLAYDFWTGYVPRRKAIQAAAVFAGVFAVPAAVHFGYIYLRLGQNFFSRVAEGYPEPYLTYRKPVLSVIYHLAELSQMAAIIPLLAAAAGLLLMLVQRDKFSPRAPLLLLWLPSLINISALYWGLIYRLRYSVLLLPAVAIFASLVVTSASAKKRTLILLLVASAALPWLSRHLAGTGGMELLNPGPGALLLPAAGLLLFMIGTARRSYDWALLAMCVLGMQIPPLEREKRPIMLETLEHEFIEPERREVMDHIRRRYDGKKILIDMGRQAPLVYDSGLNVREYIYNEGGGRLWHEALQNPGKQVGWLLMETGDAVWQRLQVDQGWAAEYALALKTEHFSLYRLKD